MSMSEDSHSQEQTEEDEENSHKGETPGEADGNENGPDPDKFINEKHVWKAKVARYLAYAVDGGILCSQFTLRHFISMLENVNDPTGNDNMILGQEIGYLLHCRKVHNITKESEKEFNINMGMFTALKNIKEEFEDYTFNPKVLVVLIETGYL